ncbi:MAG: hypothetical protein ABL958_12010 [Bdellovibrionia bacterium]
MSHEDQKAKGREELLIDYLENDIEPPLKKDLDLILSESQLDRRRLRSLKITRAAAHAAAGAVDDTDDSKFSRMHDAIMSNLDRKLIDNVVVLPARKRFVPVAAAVALVLVGSVILWNLRTTAGRIGASGDVLISESASDLEAFSDSLINTKTDDDFFIEVAARKMDSATSDETASFFNQLRE